MRLTMLAPGYGLVSPIASQIMETTNEAASTGAEDVTGDRRTHAETMAECSLSDYALSRAV